MLFVFNFHFSKSYTDYRVGVNEAGVYKVCLNSDNSNFCGQGRVDEEVKHFTTPESWDGRRNWLQVYIPTRTALVFSRVK